MTQHPSLASLPLINSVNAKVGVESDFENKSKSDFSSSSASISHFELQDRKGLSDHFKEMIKKT